MARLSKANRFLIYEDVEARASDTNATESTRDEEQPHLQDTNDGLPYDKSAQQGSNHELCVDDDRRESGLSATTVSSFPESTYQIEIAQSSCPIIRASFRRPNSVKEMQMSATPPIRASSAQRLRSSSGIVDPYYLSELARSSMVGAQASYYSDDGQEEDDAEEQDDDPLSYPLVLLHATVLPVSLPWSMETMQEMLPAPTLENLHLLRSKISDTIAQRGILMPHPHEDYELLEERILEALELRPERITKCGHFRVRHSTDSNISSPSADSDSGLGSSASESDLCSTCHHHVKVCASKAGAGQSEWSIKVFAANGLMRAPAWAAAWNEMERIDIEVLPWIDEENRRRLDCRRDEQDTQELLRQEEEEVRIRELVEEQVSEAYERKKRAEGEMAREQDRRRSEQSNRSHSEAATARAPTFSRPPVYQPSQVPISVLLRNYVYLLAQDRRNIALMFLLITTLYFNVMSTAGNVQVDLPKQWHSLDDTAHSTVPVLQPNGAGVSGSLADSPSLDLLLGNMSELLDGEPATAIGDDQGEFLSIAAPVDERVR